MSRTLILAALIAAALAQPAWAQPVRPFGPDGQRRGIDERNGQFRDSRASPEGQRRPIDDTHRENLAPRRDDGADGQRMSPDERRELRRQIRDHGRDIYRER
jgi:hypothetical protein